MPKKKTAKKTMRPGGGGRFKKLVGKLKKQGKSASSAKKIAAAVGRRKFGAKRMAKFSAQGRKRAARRRKAKK